MDLLETFRERAAALPTGDHTPGLRAVIQHIVAAEAHLARGRAGDDTAFTDVIYRTNQAFEGVLKEAYRVLASQNPEAVRPFEIEVYLQQASVLQPRVISHLSSYRTAWRNPSTHDHRLSFTEDEALFAIVTITAFAVMLTNQISEKLNFVTAQARAAAAPLSPSSTSLLDRVSDALLVFRWIAPKRETAVPRDKDLVSAIAGHLQGAIPRVTIITELSSSKQT